MSSDTPGHARTHFAANVWFCRCQNDELAGDLVFRREQPGDLEKCEDCGAERPAPRRTGLRDSALIFLGTMLGMVVTLTILGLTEAIK